MKSRHSSARTSLLAALALLVGMPLTLPAAEIQIKSDTLMRGMQRDIGGAKDQTVAPGYEYLQVDAGQLKEDGFSFHSYGWGRFDFADNNYFEDQTDGELLYGYFQYAQAASGLDLRIGRQNVAAGVGNDVIDGLQVSGDFGQWLVANAYGGQPVGYSTSEGRSGDSIYGGRLGLRQMQYGEVGISYKKIDNNDITANETLGMVSALFLPGNISLFGFSIREFRHRRLGRAFLRIAYPLQGGELSPYFGQYDYKDYFGTGVNTVNPFRVLAIDGENR